MTEFRTRLQVFVASPGDTKEERSCLDRVVAELNRGIADNTGLFLELVRWETHAWPGIGVDAQDVINREIGVPDIFIGIFWKRLGTPTARAGSGTVEEVERTLAVWRDGGQIEILVYFNQAPHTPTIEDISQVEQVLLFRQRLESLGMLVGTYEGAADFEAKVRQHLTQIIRRWPSSKPPTVSAKPATSPAPVRDDAPTAADPKLWHQQLSSGELTLALDPRSSGETYTLVSVVGSVLRESKFRDRTVDRVVIVLIELLTNVARHAKSFAWLTLKIQTEHFRSVRILIHDLGPSFSLYEVLDRHIAELNEGGREHGLLRVVRLSANVNYLARPDSEKSRHGIICEVYETPPPQSVLFDYEFVAPVRLEYEWPKVLWLGPDSYADNALWLLFDPAWRSPALLDLYLKPLLSSGPTWLGVEFTG